MKTAGYNIDPEKIRQYSEEVENLQEGIGAGEAIKIFLIFIICIAVFMSITVMDRSQWQWVTDNAYFMTHYFVYTDIAFSPFAFSMIMLFLFGFLACLYFRIKYEEETGEYTFNITFGYQLPSAEQHLNFLKTIASLALIFVPMMCSGRLLEIIYSKITGHVGMILFIGMTLVLGLAAIGGTVFGAIYLIHWRNTATDVNQYKEAYLKSKEQLEASRKKADTSTLEAEIRELNYQLEASERLQIDYYRLQQDLHAAYKLIEGRENLQEAAKKSGFKEKLLSPQLMSAYVMLKEAQQKGVIEIGGAGKQTLLCKKSPTQGQKLTQTSDARRMRRKIREAGGSIIDATKSHNGASFCSLSDMAEAGYVLQNTASNLPPLYKQTQEGNFVEIDCENTDLAACKMLHTERVRELHTLTH